MMPRAFFIDTWGSVAQTRPPCFPTPFGNDHADTAEAAGYCLTGPSVIPSRQARDREHPGRVNCHSERSEESRSSGTERCHSEPAGEESQSSRQRGQAHCRDDPAGSHPERRGRFT